MAHLIPHCEKHVTIAMQKPMLKNPGFMVIMAHWQRKGKFHGVCFCVSMHACVRA